MPERPVAVLLLFVFLAGCGGSANSGASGPAQTPTASRYFAAAGVLSLPTPTHGAATGLPTHSPLFNGPGRTVTPSQPPASAGTATVSTFFQGQSPILTPSPAVRPTGAPTTSNLFLKSGAPALDLTLTPASPESGPSGGLQAATPTTTITPTSDPAANPAELKTIPVYNGVLTAGWGLENSWGIDQGEDSTVLSPTGEKSIRFTPKEDYGTLFFTVEKNGSATYLRAKTVGVSFLLNPGNNSLSPDQLAVTVLGSNDYSYWLKGDTSVASANQGQMFSETRLYFLSVNRSLPANTWTEIIVWLNKLIYDPNYQYVTGIYLKTDSSFSDTLYVADVTLLTNP
jgi:hypothetical protein